MADNGHVIIVVLFIKWTGKTVIWGAINICRWMSSWEVVMMITSSVGRPMVTDGGVVITMWRHHVPWRCLLAIVGIKLGVVLWRVKILGLGLVWKMGHCVTFKVIKLGWDSLVFLSFIPLGWLRCAGSCGQGFHKISFLVQNYSHVAHTNNVVSINKLTL